MCILSFFLWYNWLDEMAMKLKINCLECLYFSEAVLWEIPMVTVLNLLIWVFCIQLSGATMFNLSILTSDMWAVVIRIFFYKQQVFISKLCLILLSCYIDGLNPSFWVWCMVMKFCSYFKQMHLIYLQFVTIAWNLT